MLYFLGVSFRSCNVFALGRVQMGDGLEGGEAAEGREEKGTKRRTEVVIRISNNEDLRGVQWVRRLKVANTWAGMLILEPLL